MSDIDTEQRILNGSSFNIFVYFSTTWSLGIHIAVKEQPEL